MRHSLIFPIHYHRGAVVQSASDNVRDGADSDTEAENSVPPVAVEAWAADPAQVEQSQPPAKMAWVDEQPATGSPGPTTSQPAGTTQDVVSKPQPRPPSQPEIDLVAGKTSEILD